MSNIINSLSLTLESFPGHKGIPGQRGGSLPRGGAGGSGSGKSSKGSGKASKKLGIKGKKAIDATTELVHMADKIKGEGVPHTPEDSAIGKLSRTYGAESGDIPDTDVKYYGEALYDAGQKLLSLRKKGDLEKFKEDFAKEMRSELKSDLKDMKEDWDPKEFEKFSKMSEAATEECISVVEEIADKWIAEAKK